MSPHDSPFGGSPSDVETKQTNLGFVLEKKKANKKATRDLQFPRLQGSWTDQRNEVASVKDGTFGLALQRFNTNKLSARAAHLASKREASTGKTFKWHGL